MVRSAGLPRLPLVAAGLVVLPFVAWLAAACGGSDTIDVSDGSSPDGLSPDAAPAGPDGATADAPAEDGSLGDASEADGSLGDASEADGSLRDAGKSDGSIADGGVADAHDEEDAERPDANGGDAGGPRDAEADAPDAEGLESGSDAEANLDAAADAETDAEAGLDASNDGGLLGSSKTFAVLAGTAVTTTAAVTTITGNVGVSPGNAVGTFVQPVGSIFAGDPVALQAETDLTFAYNTLAGMPCLPANNKTGTDLGGVTLPPGVYCFNSSAGITGALVLDAQLDPNATWVIQVASTLTTGTLATVSVINGGSACNVYWQIGSSATLGTGTKFAGNIVALTSITLVTGSTVLVGRTLARNGAVNFDGDTISAAACQ